jgi:photosystem II stability/assembly factor-like uncharacterized protein
MKIGRSAYVGLVALLALAAGAQANPVGFADPLDTPAQMSPLASRTLLQGVARAGNWLVAVGQRGHVVVSTDGGATWKQSAVPVSSDLTAVSFASDKKGWAVGHDGVILHTEDGGLTWTLQLDGLRANESLVQSLQQPHPPLPASEQQRLLDEAKRYKELGADKPFLDVWFADENNGYAVGAYNLIFRTSDGGKNWEPWFDRTENPKLFNLYAIRSAGGGLYIVGEGGVVLKLDGEAQRFRSMPVPYKGSFFGVVGDKSDVVVFGLRGNAFRTTDKGKTWIKIDAGLPASIVAGTTLADGAMVLADQGGRIAVSRDGGAVFKPLPFKSTMPTAGIANAGNGRLALVGLRGVVVADLPIP